MPARLRALFDETRPNLDAPAGEGRAWLVCSASGHVVCSRERWRTLRARWRKLPELAPVDAVVVALFEDPREGAQLAVYCRTDP